MVCELLTFNFLNYIHRIVPQESGGRPYRNHTYSMMSVTGDAVSVDYSDHFEGGIGMGVGVGVGSGKVPLQGELSSIPPTSNTSGGSGKINNDISSSSSVLGERKFSTGSIDQ